MKKRVPVCLFAFISLSCLINKAMDKDVFIDIQTTKDIPITINVIKDAQWSNIIKLAGPLKATILPQIVFWIEKPDGTLVDTLYITGAHMKPKSHAGKKSKGTQFWKECFPLWTAKMTAAGNKLPQEEGSDFDAITSATPQSTFTLNTKIGSVNTPFKIFAEINKSADYNSTFTEENTDWVGQPALVYSGTVTSTQKGQEYVFKLAGFDDPQKEGGINTDISRLDTSLKIVKEIKLIF